MESMSNLANQYFAKRYYLLLKIISMVFIHGFLLKIHPILRQSLKQSRAVQALLEQTAVLSIKALSYIRHADATMRKIDGCTRVN